MNLCTPKSINTFDGVWTDPTRHGVILRVFQTRRLVGVQQPAPLDSCSRGSKREKKWCWIVFFRLSDVRYLPRIFQCSYDEYAGPYVRTITAEICATRRQAESRSSTFRRRTSFWSPERGDGGQVAALSKNGAPHSRLSGARPNGRRKLIFIFYLPFSSVHVRV